MPFLCTPRITNSTDGRVSLQITDLFPHKTQSNAVIAPRFKGPLYLYAHGRDITATPALDVALDLDADYSGLATYILLSVENSADANDIALTPAEAVNVANDLILRMQGGLSLTESDINTVITARTGGANGIGVGNSTCTVLQVLQIISGYKVFTAPTGTSAGDANAADVFDAPADLSAFFSAPADASKLFNDFTNHPSFYLSARSGQLKKAQTRTNASGALEPLVVIYADDGTLIQ